MNRQTSSIRKHLPGLVFPLLVTALGVYVVTVSFNYEFETRAFANATGVIMLILSVSVLVRDILRGIKQEDSVVKSPATPAAGRIPPVLFALAWCVAFFVAVLFVGFSITVPFWVFALLLWNRASRVATVFIPILLWAMITFVLEHGLDTLLFKGILFGDRPPGFW
jgi:hypothetical protein